MYPPNGAIGEIARYVFIQHIPALIFEDTRCARAIFSVNIPDPNPNFESFASAIASSSDSKGKSDIIGPNISTFSVSVFAFVHSTKVGSI